jgi:hypothetical protein
MPSFTGLMVPALPMKAIERAESIAAYFGG